MKEIIYQSDKKEVYVEDGMTVKLFGTEYPTAAVLNEALNQARVAETDLHIPKIEEVSKIDGKWSIKMQYIPGKNIAQLMEEQPEKTDEYLDTMVQLQTEIHSKKVPLLPRLKDKMKDKVAHTTFSDEVKYELQMRIESMPKHLKLCHGDFNPENVVVMADGTMYIIDWAHATQGNASCDVARTYLYFCLKGKSDLAEKYLDKFCQKTNTEKSYVQRLLPVVAASQSVKGKTEYAEMLAKWVDVVEYE